MDKQEQVTIGLRGITRIDTHAESCNGLQGADRTVALIFPRLFPRKDFSDGSRTYFRKYEA